MPCSPALRALRERRVPLWMSLVVAGTEPTLRCFTIMLNNQRISRLSWVLAAANLLCGLVLFVLARKIALVCPDLHPPLQLPTRLFLWIGPWGWSAFMLSFSALLLVRHVRFRPDWLNPGIIAARWLTFSGAVIGVACMATVVHYQPICVFSSNIAAP